MEPGFTERRRALEQHLRRALTLDLPHPFRAVISGRPASVLVLGGIRESTGTFEILVTRRTENLETHKGQYALPGGMQDSAEESIESTALRETEEEVGVARDEVEIIGRLPPIGTPSGFFITPVVGLLKRPIENIDVRPNPAEIDIWFWCGVDRLREEGVYQTEARTLSYEGGSHTVSVDVYQVDEHRIWGATGAMLRNFIARLEKIESSI